MTTEAEAPDLGMDPATIISEVDAARERLKAAAIIDPKGELADNVYPLIKLMAESLKLRLEDMDERVELAEHAVADYLTGAESMIRAELAQQLVTVLALGQMICKETIDAFGTAKLRVPDELGKKMEGYVQLSTAAMHDIANVTLEEDDSDGDDGGDEDGQEANDG